VSDFTSQRGKLEVVGNPWTLDFYVRVKP